MTTDIEGSGDMPEIVGNLPARGEELRPVRLGREGELVEPRRDIAAQSRIGVVTPGTTDLVRLLQNGDVGDSGPPQHGCHAQPRHAGTDDGHRGIPARHATFTFASRIAFRNRLFRPSRPSR
ncbi:Uncharacterised protein [Mycobacteroides abscessus subsp. massiliense]|nr:Uncharacterised protein [Mycobacteroides abscessus subsp. massiliense]